MELPPMLIKWVDLIGRKGFKCIRAADILCYALERKLILEVLYAFIVAMCV